MIGLAFVSEQIFNNLFRGGVHLRHSISISLCLFASYKPSSGYIFNYLMRVLET